MGPEPMSRIFRRSVRRGMWGTPDSRVGFPGLALRSASQSGLPRRPVALPPVARGQMLNPPGLQNGAGVIAIHMPFIVQKTPGYSRTGPAGRPVGPRGEENVEPRASGSAADLNP